MALHETFAVALHTLALRASAPLVLQTLVEGIRFSLDGRLHCLLPGFPVVWGIFAPHAPAVHALFSARKALTIHFQAKTLLAATAPSPLFLLTLTLFSLFIPILSTHIYLLRRPWVPFLEPLLFVHKQGELIAAEG